MKTADKKTTSGMCMVSALCLGLIGGACSASAGDENATVLPTQAPTFSSTPLQTLISDSDALNVAVRTSPQPPARGANTVQLTITDANDTVVPGLSLRVQPWMPDMGHGSSVAPTVVDKGEGVYEVDSVYLSMAGSWQLRTEVTGAATDAFVIDFYVP